MPCGDLMMVVVLGDLSGQKSWECGAEKDFPFPIPNSEEGGQKDESLVSFKEADICTI